MIAVYSIAPCNPLTRGMATTERAWNILRSADLLCSSEQVDQAIVEVAAKITAQYQDRFPVVLAVMNGAIFFCGKLLPLLPFPLTLDYVHASRYGDETSGGQVTWRTLPPDCVKGREVLVVDDILDRGETLAAIRAKVLSHGARQCAIAVLADKAFPQTKPIYAEFVGVRIPNRFVFGCGLDVSGFWRNLPAIYAVKGT